MTYTGPERRNGIDRRNNCALPIGSEIERIIELTSILTRKTKYSNVVEYTIKGGKATAIGLCHRPGIFSMMILSQPKGTDFIGHKHPEFEHGLVIKGKMKYRQNGNEEYLEVGDYLKLEPGRYHGGIAIEDTEIIFISIPDSQDYPYSERI